MMKFFCIGLFALVAVCTVTDAYNSKHDDLDIAAVVEDVNKLKEYVYCFNDKIECSTLGAWFKKTLPEALQQACAKCTPAQKHIARLFFMGLKQKLPEDLEVLRNKYDPDNKYLLAMEAAVADA